MSISARSGRIASLFIFTVAAASVCTGQTYLPQIVDGGGWYSAIQLTNSTAKSATVSLTFNQDTINGATAPWNPAFAEVGSTQNLTIPAGGTLYLHTLGIGAALTQGWGQLTGTTGVIANVIYTLQGSGGRPNQDGTSPGVAGATRILVPFDATPGFATGIAIANPTAAPEDFFVNVQLGTGEVSHTAFSPIPPAGQLAFSITTYLPETAGHRGIAEFNVSSKGRLAIAAFRINPTVALTSLPVTLASGPSVIGPPPNGSLQKEILLPFYIESYITPTSSDATDTGSLGYIRLFATDTAFDYAYLDRMAFSTDGPKVFCAFDKVTNSGFTVTLSRQTDAPGCHMVTTSGQLHSYPITDASIVLTINPKSTPFGGPYTGTFSFTSVFTTVSGTIAGTYNKQAPY